MWSDSLGKDLLMQQMDEISETLRKQFPERFPPKPEQKGPINQHDELSEKAMSTMHAQWKQAQNNTGDYEAEPGTWAALESGHPTMLSRISTGAPYTLTTKEDFMCGPMHRPLEVDTDMLYRNSDEARHLEFDLNLDPGPLARDNPFMETERDVFLRQLGPNNKVVKGKKFRDWAADRIEERVARDEAHFLRENAAKKRIKENVKRVSAAGGIGTGSSKLKPVSFPAPGYRVTGGDEFAQSCVETTQSVNFKDRRRPLEISDNNMPQFCKKKKVKMVFSLEYHYEEFGRSNTLANGGLWIVRNDEMGLKLLRDWYNVPVDFPDRFNYYMKKGHKGLNYCWDEGMHPRYWRHVHYAHPRYFTAPLGIFVRHDWHKKLGVLRQECREIIYARLRERDQCVYCWGISNLGHKVLKEVE